MVAAVPDGATVALGGWGLYNAPSALARALARAGRRELTLVAPAAGAAADVLVAAGCVSTVLCASLSLGAVGPAPCAGRAAAAGALRVREIDLPALVAALRAAAAALPSGVVRDFGTDLARVNPEWYGPAPGAGERPPRLTVPALAPDVVLLHAQQGDYGGNAQHLGAAFLDPLLARAGRKVFVSVDEHVDYDGLRRAPAATRLPEFVVDGIVRLPFGAHPAGSQGRYEPDESHLRYYVEAAAAPGTLARYLAMFVTGPAGHEAYLDAVGRAALRDLRR
ncbi:MAG TPA: CoA-transferase [Methylomirabilota bacterium]|nr:CoA-transferase [Methylomirabilota bacterium]